MTAHALVVAKAPVPGQVKTRLGIDIGMAEAAKVAAAALLDTLTACREAFGVDHCHLAVAGDLDDVVREAALHEALAGWNVYPQHGEGLAERLSNAHLTLAGQPSQPVIQIGMDTPQVTPELLQTAAGGLDLPEPADAVLGPTPDGGWWVLALRDPHAAKVLRRVPMSTPTTYHDTWRALSGAGLVVTATQSLRDVDTIADAQVVAEGAPESAFAQMWRAVTGVAD